MNMPMSFGAKIEEKSFDDEVIPKDTLLWCVLSVRAIKNSRETNGRYLDIELTVAENQPYAKRKIWTKIADPFDNLNSEGWRTMAYGAIRRILEAVAGATPENVNSYALNDLMQLSGLTVPVKVGVEHSKDPAYPDDKNTVEYLSPHSTVKKIVECFGLLNQGIFKYGKEKKSTAPAPGVNQGSLFAGTATQAPAAMPAPVAPVAQAAPANPQWLANQPSATQAAAPAAPQGAPVGFHQGQAPAPQVAQSAPAAPVNAAPPPATAQHSPVNNTAPPVQKSPFEGTPAQFPAPVTQE